MCVCVCVCVCVQVVRLIANLSVSPEVGPSIASDGDTVSSLLAILGQSEFFLIFLIQNTVCIS